MSNHDRYLDPPDEPEGKCCEDCGQEMTWREYYSLSHVKGREEGHFTCMNEFCPGEFMMEDEVYESGLVHGMAVRLAEVLEELETTKRKLHSARIDIDILKDKLTRSQPKEILRDTEYQIKRMRNTLDYVFGEERNRHQVTGSDMDMIDNELAECIKIMRKGE